MNGRFACPRETKLTLEPATSFEPSNTRYAFLKWGLSGLVVLGFAFFLRYGVIQPRDVGAICGGELPPSWCMLREGVISFHRFGIWGWAGLAGGVMALFFGWRWAVWLGFVMSLMGLVLYNTDHAAIGLLLTLLVLPRASRA